MASSMVVNVGKPDEGRIIANKPIDKTQPSGLKEVLVAICPGQLATTAHISLRYEMGVKEATKPYIYPVNITDRSNPSSRAWTESEYIPSIAAKGRPLLGTPPYDHIWTWGRQSYEQLSIAETSDARDCLAFEADDIYRRFWHPLSISDIETSSASDLYNIFERQGIVNEYLNSLVVRCRKHVVELLTKFKAPASLSIRWFLVGGYGWFQDDNYRNKTEDVILRNLFVKALVDSKRLAQFDKIDFADPVISVLGETCKSADAQNDTRYDRIFKRGNKILLCGCGESRVELSALQVIEDGPILEFSRIMEDKIVEGGVTAMQSKLVDLISRKKKIDLQKATSWYLDQILMGLLDIETTWKSVPPSVRVLRRAGSRDNVPPPPGQAMSVQTEYVGSVLLPSNAPEYKFERINIEIYGSEFMELYEPIFKVMNDQINLVVSSKLWKEAKGEAVLLFWTATGFPNTLQMTSRLCTSGHAAAEFRGPEGVAPKIFNTPKAIIPGRGAILDYLATADEGNRYLYLQRFGVNISPSKQEIMNKIKFWGGGEFGSADKVVWLHKLNALVDGKEPSFTVKCSFLKPTSFPMRIYIKILSTKENVKTPGTDEVAAGWVYLRENDIKLHRNAQGDEAARYRVDLFFNFKIDFERGLADIEVKFKQSDPPKIFWPVEFECISVKLYREVVRKRRVEEVSREKLDKQAESKTVGDTDSGLQYVSVPNQKGDGVAGLAKLSPVNSPESSGSGSELPKALTLGSGGYFENAVSDPSQPWPIEFVEAGSAQRLENSIVGVEGLNLTENQSKERGRASWGTKY